MKEMTRIIAFGAIIWGLVCGNCYASSAADLIRQTVISYLSQPEFSSAGFVEQVYCKGVSFVLFDIDSQKIYFAILESQKDTILRRLAIRPDLVEFAKILGNEITFERYRFRPSKGMVYIRMPSSNLRIDDIGGVSNKFKHAVYSCNIEELVGFVSNKSVYGGYLYAAEIIDPRSIVKIPNHAAFIARKGEPSLTRLISQIGKGVKSREVLAQKLLDFVTSDIAYNEAEAARSYETLKRPNEVLMTAKSDCSGKAILYASLLDQAGIDYRLAYFPSHIAVLVQGSFKSSNGLFLQLGRTKYYLAETTAPGFVIGKSLLQKFDFEKLKYVQHPIQDNGCLVSPKTGQSIPFI